MTRTSYSELMCIFSSKHEASGTKVQRVSTAEEKCAGAGEASRVDGSFGKHCGPHETGFIGFVADWYGGRV